MSVELQRAYRHPSAPGHNVRGCGARATAAFALAAASAPAHAHTESALAATDVWLGTLLAVSIALYVLGARNLWRAAPGHRRTLLRDAASFALGWLVLTLAVLPPLAAISEQTFTGHMLQHEAIMVAAAPLLVLGRPLAIWTWAFAERWRPVLARPARWRPIRTSWNVVTAPAAATVLHAVALWAWHAPPLFNAAQADVWVHALQHSAFFFTALLFWNAVLRVSAASLFWLFVTMLHTGMLGVLLTFSPGLWYPTAPGAAAWGLNPLEDQQLGGLVMWVPGGTVYVIAALALAARWINGRAQGTSSIA